jgi:hypothetical protein
MKAWHDFAVVAGSVASALVGLLFVAVSLRESILSRSPHLRLRAAQTLGLFVTVVISAILIVVPNPADWVLGTELLVVAVLAGSVLAAFGHAAGPVDDKYPLARTVDRFNPTIITPALIAGAGALLLANLTWGLSLLVGGVVFALVAGVVNAWLILVRVHE